MKYRSEIDGLRAVAVVPVILYHAGIEIFGGGFVGVDVFFVISGYLITTIILSEMGKNAFSLVDFYERRARRILPALFLVTLTSIPFAWGLLTPSEMKDFSHSLIAVPTFSSNILFWMEFDYFDTASELKPLLHTWSLAIEEQYYVLFPLLLMLMWRFRTGWMLGSLIILAGISLAIAQWGAYNDPSAAFYLLPARGWELAIGAFIAFSFVYKKEVVQALRSKRLLSAFFEVLGFLMIGYSIFVFNEKTPFPGLYALLPTVGAGLIILFSSTETMIGRLLSLRPLVSIGLVSYSAYLWHQPMFAFARYFFFPEPTSFIFLCLIIMVFLLSYLTVRFVEKPFRNRQKLGRKAIFTFSAIGSLALVLIGLVGHFNNGFEQRAWHTTSFKKNYQPDLGLLRDKSWESLRTLSKNENYAVYHNEFDNQLWFPESNGRKNLLIIGDSHTKDMYNTLTHSKEAMAHYNIARYGTAIGGVLRKESIFFASPNYNKADIIMIASRYNGENTRRFNIVVEKIRNDKKQVVIVKSIHEFPFFGGKTTADMLLQKEYFDKYESRELSATEIVERIDQAYYIDYATGTRDPGLKISDDAIDAIAKKYPDIIVLSRMDYSCNEEAKRCYAINEDFEKYYYDYGHNTLEGAVFFGQRIDQVKWLELLDK